MAGGDSIFTGLSAELRKAIAQEHQQFRLKVAVKRIGTKYVYAFGLIDESDDSLRQIIEEVRERYRLGVSKRSIKFGSFRLQFGREAGLQEAPVGISLRYLSLTMQLYLPYAFGFEIKEMYLPLDMLSVESGAFYGEVHFTPLKFGEKVEYKDISQRYPA